MDLQEFLGVGKPHSSVGVCGSFRVRIGNRKWVITVLLWGLLSRKHLDFLHACLVFTALTQISLAASPVPNPSVISFAL